MEDELELKDKDGVREKSRKRRFSLCEETKVNIDKDEENFNGAPENKFRLIAPSFRLLDFSDEVLFEIFKYLDSWTLMALMNCCTRLSSLVLDHRFWNYIDLSKEPLPLGILEDVLERSQINTKCIKLHGPPVAQHLEREDKQFSQTLAKVFANCCKNLSILELQGITIDFRFVRITDFPSSLKRLMLNDCNIRLNGEKSVFLGIDTHLTLLEELAIENSNWFEPYYMMVFSKLPELRSLSLKGCQLLSDFVPYGSMATRFGFKKLEYLDLRFTPISDSDLQCFSAVATLKEVLLESPESLPEINHETAQDKKINVRNCYCHSLPNAETAVVNNGNADLNVESPSTSNASRLRTTVSVENSASTSAAATEQSQLQCSTSHSSQEQHPAREEDSSFSSYSSNSSSPSSTSSNESLPLLLGNSTRAQASALELPLPGGNAPPFSRFLPRPDQIILLDLNNRWRHVVMPNAPTNNGENVGIAEQQQQVQSPHEPPVEPLHQPVERQQPLEEEHPQQLGPAQQPPDQRQENPMHDRSRLRELRVLLHRQLHRPMFEMQQIHNRNPNNNNINNNINNNNNDNGNLIVHNANQVEQVLNHPLFWDMINPFARFGRAAARRLAREGGGGEPFDGPRRFDFRHSQCFGQHQYHRNRHRPHHHPISDRGICCFGRPRNPVEHGIIWIRIGNRPSENRLERLSIRNYKLVTDVSLQHLVQCSPYLVYLDLSGTGVTQRGIDAFKERKPECIIVADHLSKVDKQSCESECNGNKTSVSDCSELQTSS